MRRAYVLVTPSFIADICKPMSKRCISSESEVPPDAKFISAEYSDSEQAFMIIFEHESFEDIPEGVKIPMINKPIFTRYFSKDDFD